MPVQTKPVRASLTGMENVPDMPVLYEDEDEGEMGESDPHVRTTEILHIGVGFHIEAMPRFRVFCNLNMYYLPGPPHPRTGVLPYLSPDFMLVEPLGTLPADLHSYTIGRDGPAPRVTAEVLSQRSAQQRDLEDKVVIYGKLGVAEYILIDPRAVFLPDRLLLKRLQADGTFKDEQDTDGGVTSVLGFRLIMEADGLLRVIDAKTGVRYPRPSEAKAEAQARRIAEEKLGAREEKLGATEEKLGATEEKLGATEEKLGAAEEEIRRLRAQLDQK